MYWLFAVLGEYLTDPAVCSMHTPRPQKEAFPPLSQLPIPPWYCSVECKRTQHKICSNNYNAMKYFKNLEMYNVSENE